MVATPIGNLADLSLRAIHVLGLVQAVAFEDTRVAATLLRHLGLQPPLLALHTYNEHEAAARVLARLAGGESVAHVSDAGTPAVSDPGAALVAQAAAAGHTVVPVPGASSALAALSVAGDIGGKSRGGGFHFVDFLPAKGGERHAAWAAELAAAAPTRRVTLCRDLTKQFETVVTQAADTLPAWLAADDNRLRGEFVLVLHARAAAQEAGLPAATLRTLDVLLRNLPLSRPWPWPWRSRARRATR